MNKKVSVSVKRVFKGYDFTECTLKDGIFSGIATYTNANGNVSHPYVVASVDPATEKVNCYVFIRANEMENMAKGKVGQAYKALVIKAVDDFARAEKEEAEALKLDIRENKVAQQTLVKTNEATIKSLLITYPRVSKMPKAIHDLYTDCVAQIAEYNPTLAKKYANKK